MSTELRKKHTHKTSLSEKKSGTAQFAVLDSRSAEYWLVYPCFDDKKSQRFCFLFVVTLWWSSPVCQPFFLISYRYHIHTYRQMYTFNVQGDAWFFSTFQNIQRSYNSDLCSNIVCECSMFKLYKYYTALELTSLFGWIVTKKKRKKNDTYLRRDVIHLLPSLKWLDALIACICGSFRENWRLKGSFATGVMEKSKIVKLVFLVWLEFP